MPPATGKNFFTFRIAYGRCGTKPDLHGQFYENTVVVQYDKDLLEVWDEAKRLRCEWFNDYEKTASKPPMVIADLDVIQLDFRGDNVDCWMEIQHGKGPWAPPVSGIVPLGSTLTLVVAINDYRGEFDMRVKSCVASDGAGHIIKLTDEYGCVLRPKMISRFLKARAPNEKATVITYAFFHAFKFPDALSVHIKCKVEICRHGCLDHCQLTGNVNERKDTLQKQQKTDQQELLLGVHPSSEQAGNLGAAPSSLEEDDADNEASNNDSAAVPGGGGMHNEHDVFYDDLISSSEALIRNNQAAQQQQQQQHHHHHPTMFHQLQQQQQQQPLMKSSKSGPAAIIDERFPHGPRQLEAKDRIGLPSMAGPRALDLASLERQQQRQQSMFVRPELDDAPASSANSTVPSTVASQLELEEHQRQLQQQRVRRVRRMVRVPAERHVRSADVGVSGLYEVISEADLAFSPDTRQEAVTVFQGKITEDIVYGICMPVPGFSVLFIVVASAAIVSALVAGSLLYRYRVQRDTMRQQQHRHQQQQQQSGGMRMALDDEAGTIASWMTMRLFRIGQQPQQQCHQTTDQTMRNVSSASATAPLETTLAVGAPESRVFKNAIMDESQQ